MAVTPLRAGLHLRGRRESVTLEGSEALPALWRVTERPLREGRFEEFLDSLGAGSAPHRAVSTLVARLAEHDLFLPDAGPGTAGGSAPVADWLGVTATRPDAARSALAGTRAEVASGTPDDPLADAVARALTAGGLRVSRVHEPELPPHQVLLSARRVGFEVRAVAVGRHPGGGHVTAVASPAQARSDAHDLAARLGPADPPHADPDVAPEPAAFLPLLAGAAAHRLLCAAAGLPDPATEGDDDRLLPGLPAVLLAETRPPRAEYLSRPGRDRIDADRRPLPPPASLGEALRRLAALTDVRAGSLPEPVPAGLPQLPVPLARCPLPDPDRPERVLVTGAPRLDLARLELLCRAAELRLGEGLFTVGLTPAHALGRALRASLAARPRPGSTDGTHAEPAESAVPADRWSEHPQARHWWHTLTVRLGVPARMRVVRLAPDAAAYRADVLPDRSQESSGPESGGPVPLGTAVEATPGDAAAFAALAAVARAGVPEGADVVFVPGSGGAIAPTAAAGAGVAAWEDTGWTGQWLAELAAREDAFLRTAARLTSSPEPPPATGPSPRTGPPRTTEPGRTTGSSLVAEPSCTTEPSPTTPPSPATEPRRITGSSPATEPSQIVGPPCASEPPLVTGLPCTTGPSPATEPRRITGSSPATEAPPTVGPPRASGPPLVTGPPCTTGPSPTTEPLPITGPSRTSEPSLITGTPLPTGPSPAAGPSPASAPRRGTGSLPVTVSSLITGSSPAAESSRASEPSLVTGPPRATGPSPAAEPSPVTGPSLTTEPRRSAGSPSEPDLGGEFGARLVAFGFTVLRTPRETS
ncbi:hypothetical protein ACN20G_34155 (plasmid) [Streptomyces sp. BI20]|uniref:hypothetical protein n=1 Tax=Streptomyces sp. BI20 TaxID=3403460 RepID=UPI003C7737AC